MKIYRVSYRGDRDGHEGYSYHASRAGANRARREHTKQDVKWEIEIDGPFEVPLTKKGVIGALNLFGAHADNG